MKKIEHIGIAVKNIDDANSIYEKLLGTSSYKTEAVLSENVITSFFKCGESKIELLQATNENSAIAKFIDKRGEGIHHIAFEVEDIHGVGVMRSGGGAWIQHLYRTMAVPAAVLFLPCWQATASRRHTFPSCGTEDFGVNCVNSDPLTHTCRLWAPS